MANEHSAVCDDQPEVLDVAKYAEIPEVERVRNYQEYPAYKGDGRRWKTTGCPDPWISAMNIIQKFRRRRRRQEGIDYAYRLNQEIPRAADHLPDQDIRPRYFQHIFPEAKSISLGYLTKPLNTGYP